jgi:hypothetical protein
MEAYMPVSSSVETLAEALKNNPVPAAPALSDEEIEQKLDTVDNNVKAALKQAIKDYQDEQLTGLTDEEREKIEAEVRAYLEANPGDIEGAMRLRKSLMKKYGFKGDPDQECYYELLKTVDKSVEHTDQDVKPAQQTVYHKVAAEKARAANA